jgi:ribose transport system substrate-binding protein
MKRPVSTRRLAIATGLILAASGIAACSSNGYEPPSNPSGSTGTSGATTGVASSSDTSNSGVAAAQSYLNQYLQAPTSVGITTQLGTKPANKLVVAIEPAVPAAKQENDYMAQALTVLGLKLKRIVIGDGPQAIADAFNTALSDNPAVITEIGQQERSFATQLAEAKSRNIAVIETSGVDDPGNGLVSTGVNNAAMTVIEAKIGAAFFVVDSNGKGKAAIYNLPALANLALYTTTFVTAVKQWCPECSTTVVPTQVTDIGTAIPGQVVSFQQAHPDVTYAVFCLGDQTLGLSTAMKSAGITNVKVMGQAPSGEDLESLKSNGSVMWTAVSLPVIAWRNADAIARVVTGSPLDGTDSEPLPTQALTPDSIKTTIVDSNGNWVGYGDYETAFKKLWGLS